MRFLFQFTMLLLLLAVLAPVAFGGNVEDGLAAAESGDFKTAHSLWLAEAEQGKSCGSRLPGNSLSQRAGCRKR